MTEDELDRLLKLNDMYNAMLTREAQNGRVGSGEPAPGFQPVGVTVSDFQRGQTVEQCDGLVEHADATINDISPVHSDPVEDEDLSYLNETNTPLNR